MSSSSVRSGSSRSSRVTTPTPFCKVCYDAGLPVADYTNHFVKDQPGPNGKVVCPTLLAQKCLKCGVPGHTSSYCPEEMRLEREQKERERDTRRVITCDANGWKVVGSGGAVVKSKPRIETASAQVSASRGVYGLLAVDDADSDHEHENEEEIQKIPTNVPKPAPAAAVVDPAKPMTWAQRAAAAATKMPTTSTLPSSRSAAPVTDTRFQLNYLCNHIEITNRAPSAKKAPAANYRANAASVASECSLKRKQESVTIPA